MESQYSKLRQLNVNDKIEKKGKHNYLSWALAVDTLLQHDPQATWEYKWFNDQPFCTIAGDTYMVFCTVHAFGKSMTAHLPVLDYLNKPIKQLDSMSVNTTMQRVLAKAIALHGIGLYIYSGEDMPEAEEEQLDVVDIIEDILSSKTMNGLKKVYIESVKKLEGNKNALTHIEKAKDTRKKELQAIDKASKGENHG
jgi:hypothetical protein